MIWTIVLPYLVDPSSFCCYSGLIKAKKYDWKDSNMALFGSDTERQVKSKCNVKGQGQSQMKDSVVN